MAKPKRRSKKRRIKKRKPKLGSGERFKTLAAQLERRGAYNARALAAWIGARKYGKKRMQSMARAGAQK